MNQQSEIIDSQEQIILNKLLYKEAILDKIISKYTVILQKFKNASLEDLEKDVTELLKDLDLYEFHVAKSEIQLQSVIKDLSQNEKKGKEIQVEIENVKIGIKKNEELLKEEIQKKAFKVECNQIVDQIIAYSECEVYQNQIDSISEKMSKLEEDYKTRQEQIVHKQRHVQNIFSSLQELIEGNTIQPIQTIE
ncbi:U-box protein (macronuclear) [Tetrahymena thermophila SB210]|uniref:U-box protein n=1 Tax=Tetrahymena thermophila (strain SB210) TaxID=312017 RepID=I7M0G5_TETTS|nr:U-box protein [Tetrahymena thermophila SB210]EAR87531.2 U-box protein [Tetrahymena thermophila SB210]|eukprot:XP_001007776.2 U-box protein [Tetrahymena thermophila SB210]